MSQSKILLDNKSNELELIEFYIDEQLPDGGVYRGHYGMNVAKVIEIIRKPPVTAMPNKHHAAALGTFNLRGRVLPLVDLAVWLGKNMLVTDNLKVIVSEYSSVVTAFLVSGVTRIHRLSWTQVEPPGRHLQSYSALSITGVVRIEGRILFILDMEQLIATLNPNLDMSQMIDGIMRDNAPVADAERFHILIADDSQVIRSAISKTLSNAGYQVSTTANGKEAWEQLCAIRQQSLDQGRPIDSYVDLIISDIEMPEMDGHALTKLIKSDNVLRDIPVVLFSSLFTEAMREKGLKAGADYQISKPDLPHLTTKIREFITERHGK